MLSQGLMRLGKSLAVLSIATHIAGVSQATAGDLLRLFRTDTSVDKLARHIDRMQNYLDCYGTIVPKTPDVWGESRLLAHRIDFENVINLQKDKFQFLLNAQSSTNDGAFLANALALATKIPNGANDGNLVALVGGTGTASNTNIPVNTIASDLVSNPTLGATAGTPPSYLVPRSDFGITSTRRTPFVNPVLGTPLGGSGIEPTIYLDQMKRYLDHLNEIRRTNEGDDTADAPGYSLNLIRIPISVTPGMKTREGFGAEVSVTVKPVLSSDLLPSAFRDLVINGATDRVTTPVIQIADQFDISLLRAESDQSQENFWKGFRQSDKEAKSKKPTTPKQLAAQSAMRALPTSKSGATNKELDPAQPGYNSLFKKPGLG